jgi:hypothetical protein
MSQKKLVRLLTDLRAMYLPLIPEIPQICLLGIRIKKTVVYNSLFY